VQEAKESADSASETGDMILQKNYRFGNHESVIWIKKSPNKIETKTRKQKRSDRGAEN
jgi:hypothetical protein